MASELTFRGQSESHTAADSYSPKPLKPWLSISSPIRYLLREQRLLCVLAGIAIATVLFSFLPNKIQNQQDQLGIYRHDEPLTFENPTTTTIRPQQSYEFHSGKIALGLKSKGLRIVVTGGAGFVGSHLVDRLIARGDSLKSVETRSVGQNRSIFGQSVKIGQSVRNR
ncbi:UDP-glucuronic acid decarboxylase 2 [Linum perenne]